MAPTSAAAVPALDGVASRIDEVLLGFLEERRAEAAAIEPRSTEPIEEIERLVRAGGKRIRPAFCVWGYRAAGGPDVPAIWDAAAALELLHTMALIHDDVMDDDEQRRGEPTVHARQTAVAARRGWPAPSWSAPGSPSPATWRPHSRTSCSRPGFPFDRQAAAARFQTIRLELALGAYLDLAAAVAADTVAYLKAALQSRGRCSGRCSGGRVAARGRALRRYARPLGAAFNCSTISPTATPCRCDTRGRGGGWRRPGTLEAAGAGRSSPSISWPSSWGRCDRGRGGHPPHVPRRADLSRRHRASDGGPHVAPRFVWQEDAIYVATRVGDTAWEDALRDLASRSSSIAVGTGWAVGARIDGTAESLPAEHPDPRADVGLA
jgi:hypothetical protein